MKTYNKKYLKTLFTDEFTKEMPIGYHMITNFDFTKAATYKACKSEFYRSDRFACDPFYKPVTRCFQGYTERRNKNGI